MKITYKIDKIKKNNWLNIAFDVSKDSLSMYTEMGNENITCIADAFENNTAIIKSRLGQLCKHAQAEGYASLHIICEPTGGYENKLLNSARQAGYDTSYVSGESSHKFKLVEDNTADKSDQRDAKVIFKLAQYGKLLKHRIMAPGYKQLRHLNRMHEQEQRSKTDIRNQLHHELKILFCQHDWKEAFWYGASGRVLIKHFHANPFRIISAGKSRFTARMKKYTKGIRNATIERIWANAQLSLKINHDPLMIDLWASRIKQLWLRFLDHEQTLIHIKKQMAIIYSNLLDQGEGLPPVIKGFVSIENLARIAGEVGPFSDFNCARQIKRYAGMNIRIKESGYFKGTSKLSKKGRPRLRMILNQSIFRLIKKEGMLGTYYHALKGRGMSGTKAMSIVSRKLLDILFALSKPGVSFDENRLFVSKQNFKKAA